MMGFEQEIKKHAKSSREIERVIVQWRETFRKGAMGNQEAYAEARDTREELERSQWVRVEDALAVYRLHCKKLAELLKNRPKPMPVDDSKQIWEYDVDKTDEWFEELEGLLKK